MLDALDDRYRLILCDIWGCIHDGVELYPGAAERLRRWRAEGRTVVLITNAPRTVGSVETQLERIGLPDDSWDAITTSGETGIAALKSIGGAIGFVGTAGDRAILEASGVVIADDGAFSEVAVTGFEERRPDAGDYSEQLANWVKQDVRMHCLNPDRVVIYGGVAEACAGALADVYEALGGHVVWYGKPYEPIYAHALQLGGNPAAREVLAIGDGLQTDVLGAARMGFDCIYVSGGIHQGQGFPAGFGASHGLGEWRPLAVVESLR